MSFLDTSAIIKKPDHLSIATISSSRYIHVKRKLLLPTVCTTVYGEIVPRITGSISIVSSTLLIYIIIVSPTKLTSVTYRIMFGMSISDIIGSIMMALSHLPMPRVDQSYKFDSYNFQGQRIGNNFTCSAQGFLASFGIMCTCGYNAMLCIYGMHACMYVHMSCYVVIW